MKKKVLLYLMLLINYVPTFSQQYHWTKTFGSNKTDVSLFSVVDKEGNIYATGYFALKVDFNPGGSSGKLDSAGFIDALVLKLDTDGNYIWVKAFNGSEYVKALFITSDKYDNVYVTNRLF